MRSRSAVTGSAFRTVTGPLDTHQLIPLDCQLLPPAFSSAFGIPNEADLRRGGFRSSIGQVFRGQVPLPSAEAYPATFLPASRRVNAAAAPVPTQASRHKFVPPATEWQFQAPLSQDVAPAIKKDAQAALKKDTAKGSRKESAKSQSDAHTRARHLPEGHQQVLHVKQDRPADLDAAPSEDAFTTKPLHRSRVVWSDELHQRFLNAIEVAGSLDSAVPTVILKLMNVTGLSRDNVASHLQKHRMGLKRGRGNKRRESPARAQRTRQKAATGGASNAVNAASLPLATSAAATAKSAYAKAHPTAGRTASHPPPALATDDVCGGSPGMKPGEGETVNADDEERGGSNGAGSNREGSNDREGSNHRAGSNDREGSNDGPGSEDGGAGSDNGKMCNAVDAPAQLPPSGSDQPSTTSGERDKGPPDEDCHASGGVLAQVALTPPLACAARDATNSPPPTALGASVPGSQAERGGSNVPAEAGSGGGTDGPSGSGADDRNRTGECPASGEAGSGGSVEGAGSGRTYASAAATTGATLAVHASTSDHTRAPDGLVPP